MSPEKRISVHGGNQLYFYIRGKGAKLFTITPEDEPAGKKLHVSIAGPHNEVEERISMVSFAIVDGEPIVVCRDAFSKSCDERVLFCSEKHAKELSERGIIKFPKPPKRKFQWFFR